MDVPADSPQVYFWLNVAAIVIGGGILASASTCAAGIWWSYRKFTQFETTLEAIRDMLAGAVKRIDVHELRWEQVQTRVAGVETRVAVLESRDENHTH